MRKFTLLFILFFASKFYAQTQLVFVFFTDKPNKTVFYANPLSELSQKSLERRTMLGIPLNDQDAPIEQTYIQNIQNLGFTVTDYSKWLNGVAVNADASQIALLQAQPYVQSVESFAKNTSDNYKTTKPINKFENFNKSLLVDFNYGSGLDQINQINLRTLHIAGYTGNGKTIAVIDTGFPTVDTGAAYQRLWTNNKIKGGYNFISKNSDIYNTTLNSHGSYVLGAIGGYIDGTFVGSAPDAEFYLYATEKSPEEIPEEELYWIEAAEEADRKGVDIITSSLGYSVYDNPIYNYTYANMNGTTSFIARGAQIATEKGIFVLVAAGNSAQQSWHYILTPADNAKVFTIGAVDAAGNPSTFSSFGPNSANIIKPDATARGTTAATVYNDAATSASGTSLSTPIAAGGVACLLQAIPANTPMENIRTRLRETASLYPNPTDQSGFGILNFGNAMNFYLNSQHEIIKEFVRIYPNPAKDKIFFETQEKIKNIEVYDALGRLIFASKFIENPMNISYLPKGIYYLKLITEKNNYVEKLIKD